MWLPKSLYYLDSRALYLFTSAGNIPAFRHGKTRSSYLFDNLIFLALLCYTASLIWSWLSVSFRRAEWWIGSASFVSSFPHGIYLLRSYAFLFFIFLSLFLSRPHVNGVQSLVKAVSLYTTGTSVHVSRSVLSAIHLFFFSSIPPLYLHLLFENSFYFFLTLLPFFFLFFSLSFNSLSSLSLLPYLFSPWYRGYLGDVFMVSRPIISIYIFVSLFDRGLSLSHTYGLVGWVWVGWAVSAMLLVFELSVSFSHLL